MQCIQGSEECSELYTLCVTAQEDDQAQKEQQLRTRISCAPLFKAQRAFRDNDVHILDREDKRFENGVLKSLHVQINTPLMESIEKMTSATWSIV